MNTGYKQISLTRIAPGANASVIDCLKVVTQPNIPAPGRDELLLRTRLSAIHPCDLLCCAGLVSRNRHDGAAGNARYLPGIEALAVIEAVGAELQAEYSPGQRVSVKAWSPWGRWEEADGVWSEYLRVKKDKIIVVPDGVSDTNAAMFFSICVTAYVMVICELKLKRGDWLVQAAAGSALGRWIIALARQKGINVINLVRREEQVDELKSDCGAEHVFCCPTDGSRTEELVRQIKELSADGKIMGALDPIADGVVAGVMLRVMARYGTILKYGGLGGGGMSLSHPAILCMSQEALQIKGFSIQNWWMPDTPNEEKRRVFDEIWQLLRDNPELDFEMAGLYDFDQIGDAIRASLGEKSAKIFLTPRLEDHA